MSEINWNEAPDAGHNRLIEYPISIEELNLQRKIMKSVCDHRAEWPYSIYINGVTREDFELCIRELSDHAGAEAFLNYLKKVSVKTTPSIKIIQIQTTSDDYILGLGDDGVIYIEIGHVWRVHTPLNFEVVQ